jgi:hypothetical protein
MSMERLASGRPLLTHDHRCPWCGKIYQRVFARCIHPQGDRLPCFKCAKAGKGTAPTPEGTK